MSKTDLALPIAIVYTMTTVGSIYGGWLSGNLIKRGWEVYKARRTAMLIFALCVLPVVTAQALGQYSYWFAIFIVGIAASAHQAWSANIFTTTSDMFPKRSCWFCNRHWRYGRRFRRNLNCHNCRSFTGSL